MTVQPPARPTPDPANSDLVSTCPECGALVDDLDGFGVLVHDDCGYCSHPCSTGGYCDHCFMRTA